MAKDSKTAEGEWTSGPNFFEQQIDEKRAIKACIATSPDGREFVSIREWRAKQDGTPYYTRNSVLVPIGDEVLRDAFVAALTTVVPAKPTPAKKKAKAK